MNPFFIIRVKCGFGINVKRQATLRFLCGASMCVAFSTALGATVKWHFLGSSPPLPPPPVLLVTIPVAPTTADPISFVAPTDGHIYGNAQFASDTCGNPLISVDSAIRTVNVTFTARQNYPIPGPFFVSGVDGQFGPLAAGTWSFQVFSNSSALLYSSTFTVIAPPVVSALGITRAGSQVVLSWPVLASNYVLQAATDLSAGNWSNVTNGIATSGTNYVFTNSITNQADYFRLQNGT